MSVLVPGEQLVFPMGLLDGPGLGRVVAEEGKGVVRHVDRRMVNGSNGRADRALHAATGQWSRQAEIPHSIVQQIDRGYLMDQARARGGRAAGKRAGEVEIESSRGRREGHEAEDDKLSRVVERRARQAGIG